MFIPEALKYIESAQMRDFITSEEPRLDIFKLDNWCNIVVKARASLQDKIMTLSAIAAKYDKTEYCDPLELAENAQNALELTKGGYCFEVEQYNLSEPDDPSCYHHSGVVATFDDSIKAIREDYDCEIENGEMLESDIDDYGLLWNKVTRYDKAEDGKLDETITYYVGESGVIWSYYQDKNYKSQYLAYVDPELYAELDLVTPFQPGDILISDMRPFEDVKYALVICNRTDYPWDCCYPFCLYRNEHGKYDALAIQHWHDLPHFSPYYRMRTVEKRELPRADKFLATISEAIKRDPTIAKKIDDNMLKTLSKTEIEALIRQS